MTTEPPELQTLREENARLRLRLCEVLTDAQTGRELVAELKAIVEQQQQQLRFLAGDFSGLTIKGRAKKKERKP